LLIVGPRCVDPPDVADGYDWSSAAELPPPDLLAALAPHLTETVELLDERGRVRWRLGPPEGLLGRRQHGGSASVFAYVHPDDLPRMLEFGTQVAQSPPGWEGSLTTRLQHSDETWREYLIEIKNCTDDPALGAIVVRTRPTRSVPGRLDLDDASMAESIAEAVPMALVVLDRLGRMEFANQAARAMCDLPDGPTSGRFLADLAVDGDRSTLAKVVDELLEREGSSTVAFDTHGWQGRGERRTLEARLLARAREGRPSTIVVTLDDVTERRRHEDDLRRRASEDPLTGLLNRAALLEEMETRLELGPLTVIYCDLDGFKAVNDTFGHHAGDELLVEVAKVLRSMARATDAIGRLGGDEFVIVCDGLTKPHTSNLIARLGDALDASLGVRISVGVAGSPAGGSASDVLARADRAMYANKRRSQRPIADEPTLR
jgi:cyclic di-GMP phosphodiesterase Gmr